MGVLNVSFLIVKTVAISSVLCVGVGLLSVGTAYVVGVMATELAKEQYEATKAYIRQI